MPPGVSTCALVCQFFFTSGSILNKGIALVPSSTTVTHDEAVLGDVKPDNDQQWMTDTNSS
jgi:hypothetical protein